MSRPEISRVITMTSYSRVAIASCGQSIAECDPNGKNLMTSICKSGLARSYLKSGVALRSIISAPVTNISNKMKEAIVRNGPKVEIIDSPVPKAGKDQVVIKTIYSGSNPKDW